MDFAAQEYEVRLRRARELMSKDGLDALLVTGIENYAYFTGVPIDVYNPYRPWCAIIPLNEDPMLVISTVLKETHAQESHYQNIKYFPGRAELNFGKAVVNALTDLRLTSSKMGCELGADLRLGIPYNTFEEIRKGLPKAKFVDATETFWELRSIKSAAEIDYMRKACDITGRARQRSFGMAKEGMTEQEFAGIFARTMIEEGATRPFFIYVNSGPFHSLHPGYDRKLKKGDILWTDGGAAYRGYISDYSRMAVVGQRPTERQALLHKAIVDLTHRVMEQIKPGQRICDVCFMVEKELKKLESEKLVQSLNLDLSNRTQHYGHAQGMEVTEMPFVAPYHENILRRGMVFSLEPGILAEEGMFIWEDVLAVTETGVDLLSTETPELIQI